MNIVLMAPIDKEAGIHNWGAPALGIMRIVSYIKHKLPWVNIETYDSQIDFFDPIEKWAGKHIDILGVSLLHYTLFNSLGLIWEWKKKHPESLVVVGGNEAGANYQQIFDNSPVDIVVTAEGEDTLLDIILWKANHTPLEGVEGIIWRSHAVPITDSKLWEYWRYVDFSRFRYGDYWDQIEKMYEDPDYEKIRYVRLMTTSHCMRNCSFCSLAKVRNFACGEKVKPAMLTGDQIMDIINRIHAQLPTVRTLYFCFTKDNYVLTKDGLKNIADIKVGDCVYNDIKRLCKVKKVFSREYTGKLFRIRPHYSSRYIECTSNHKFITRDGVKQADELTKNDYLIKTFDPNIVKLDRFDIKDIYLSLNITHVKKCGRYRENDNWDSDIPESINVEPDLLRLFGLYIAEGSSNRAQVSFDIDPKRDDLIDFIRTNLKKYFNKECKVFRSDTAKRAYINSTCLAKLFGYLFGCNALEKRIPIPLTAIDPKLQRYIIQGVWWGDGSMKKVKRYGRIWQNIRISSSSSRLIYQISNIAMRNKLIPSIFEGKIIRKKDSFINGRKLKFNAIPYSIVLNCQSMDDFISGKYNIVDSNDSRYGYIDSCYAYCKVRSIEQFEVVSEKVYNLTVDDDRHTYNISGFSVKNCTDDVFYPRPKPFLDFMRMYNKSGYDYRILIQTSSFSLQYSHFPLLKAINCQHITIGVENASAEMRKEFNKQQDEAKLEHFITLGRQYGIAIYYLIILIPPASTIHDLIINYNTITRWIDQGVQISIEPLVYSYRGTPVYDDIRFQSSRVVRQIPGTRLQVTDSEYILPVDPEVREIALEMAKRKDEYVDNYFKSLPTGHKFKGLTSKPILLLLRDLLREHGVEI